MIRTKKRDFWMRLGLIIMIASSILPYAYIDGYSLTLTIPVAIFIWLIVTFGLLIFLDQLTPIISGTKEIIVKISKRVFTYMEIDVAIDKQGWNIKDRRIWCTEQLQNFWFEMNGVYFFLYKRDAMAFKLVWI